MYIVSWFIASWFANTYSPVLPHRVLDLKKFDQALSVLTSLGTTLLRSEYLIGNKPSFQFGKIGYLIPLGFLREQHFSNAANVGEWF
ncbi:hypothetical protein [Entomobacter blattae]|uniref:Uncharacterized protein n=1 Tax=Entomobacter blattae TaxID=2762277 RepID=A0A7H1NUN5_9PROT|nr:hypothetical protein [Entomobacter blattae]QNT79495.1 hypothetical protein JGUZn3_22940 [Entomobacter blattae]